MKPKGWRLLMWVSFAAFVWQTCAQPVRPGYVVYSTDFEPSEGYDARYVLGAPNNAGQNGWLADGTGGNGLINIFAGYGQQAYVGIFPPLDTNSFTTIWRPFGMPPISTNQPVVKFSTVMQIITSTSGGKDDFRWSVYNTNGIRLFSLDFEGATGLISYLLDDGQFVSTDFTFSYEPDGVYDLEIWMNLSRNRWTALLNGEVLASGLRMTTTGTPLSIGDVDAVWAIANISSPGNNYLAFDNYRVTVESDTSIPPVLKTRTLQSDNIFRFDLFGEPGLNYEVDVTEDFVHWIPLGTYGVEENGSFIFEDTESSQFPTGFYRALEAP